MTAYVESVEDLEQDTVLSLLAYHSWRWGHQVTLHRPQDGPHQWSPEQTAKWDIVLQLTPEGFYILTHSRLPDATSNAQALPLAQPQEDNADTPPPEECNWDPPTATTERMPHRLTKRHLPQDCHATNDSRGRRTLPLQWASPEGTFTWGEILPGTVALTYLWLRDAETHTQPPGTHLLLTLEREAAVENVHTAEGEDYVTANADTAVWLHAHEHTTPPTEVGVTPLARGHRATTHRGRHRKRPTGMGGQVGTRVHLPARRAAQTLPHQSHPRAGPHHGRIPHRAGPPHRSLGLHAHPPPRGSGGPQDRHLQPPGPRANHPG